MTKPALARPTVREPIDIAMKHIFREQFAFRQNKLDQIDKTLIISDSIPIVLLKFRSATGSLRATHGQVPF